MLSGHKITDEEWDRFFVRLSEHGNVRRAAREVPINKWTAYNRRKADPEFAQRWDEAVDDGNESLVEEAYRRAVEGTEEYITCKDGLIYGENGRPVMQRRYSDMLLVQLLRAKKPHEFRDRVEHTGKDGGPIQVEGTLGLSGLLAAAKKAKDDDQ